jgi:hypothetical protein
MKSAALIACSNGLGHIRRILLLAKELANKQLKVTIFAPLRDVAIFDQLNNFTSIKIVDFDTKTSAVNWIDGNAKNWYKLLPDLSEFDIIVSDNLIEILNVRRDAWLLGSFFWHESINNFPEKLKKESRDLLLEYKPRMISSAIFSSKKLKKYTQLYEVGIFSNFDLGVFSSKGQSKNDALIACGKGGDIIDTTQDFINKLSKEEKVIFDTVWIEPGLFPKNAPSWMKKATFTNKMYQSLMVSVIRPGVGTITDSFLHQSKVFLYYEPDNLEMRENALKIDVLGLGVNSIEILNAWKGALIYMKNPDLQVKFSKKIGEIDIDGARESADIISGVALDN